MPLSDYFPELEGWKPVDKEATSVTAPSQPDSTLVGTTVSSYLRTTLPLPLQYQQDTLRQYNRPGLSSYRLSPLAPNASSASVAATASTSKIVAQQVVQSTPGKTSGVTSVGLSMPNIFTVTGSPVTSAGTLTAALATEAPSTYFSTPSAALPSIENFTTGFLGTGAGGSGTFTLTLSPTTATSWGIYAAAANNTLTTPPGFTAFTGGISNAGGYVSALSGTNPISISQSLIANSTDSGVFVVFAGSQPTIVQQAAATYLGSTPLTKAFSANNTAGNTIIVIVNAVNNTFGPFSLSVSDSAGNAYTTIGYVQGSGVWQPSTLIAIATNVAGSANTVSAVISGHVAGGASGVLQIIEYPALTAASNIPVFKPISTADIPPIRLNSTGNGGTSGILPPVKGGTGSDLSTTGGVSLFLSQLSTGANISPTQPDYSDLAGVNRATKYNNVTLVSNGLPSEVATVDKTAQTAAIATTTLYAVPTTAQYRLSWNAKVTTAAGTSSTLGPLTITYTDADATVQTITMAAQNSAGTIETSDAGNTTTTVMLGNTVMLNARASTNIQYAFAYASNPAAAMNYNLHIKLESL